MAVRFSTIHRRAFYAMHTYYRILTTNVCKEIVLCKILTIKRCKNGAERKFRFFCDAPQLTTSDEKLVVALLNRWDFFEPSV